MAEVGDIISFRAEQAKRQRTLTTEESAWLGIGSYLFWGETEPLQRHVFGRLSKHTINRDATPYEIIDILKDEEDVRVEFTRGVLRLLNEFNGAFAVTEEILPDLQGRILHITSPQKDTPQVDLHLVGEQVVSFQCHKNRESHRRLRLV